MFSKRSLRRGAAVALAAFLTVIGSTQAAPTPAQLVFDGVHNVRLLHEGPFTGSAPFCSSGYAADVDLSGEVALRRHTCGDGRGTFDARIASLPAEHGGSGTWQVVAGTGELSRLRGRGTWTSVRVAGDPSDPATIVFRSMWQGIADLDDTAPAITLTRATTRKLRRPARTYTLQIAFVARDDIAENRVAYVVGAQVGMAFSFRRGETSTGTVSVSFRVRPARGVKTVRVRIRAGDPIGNERELVRTVRLPSR